ncbi:MAG: AAA family ATPase [Fimbriimonadaceae bacterium]|nr:AAA family ATPase [Fimbriimonadaceae bacterium]
MPLSDLPRERLDLSRILIYGVTGSGKTTLAAQLSEKLGLPFHSVDELCWGPNWQIKPDEEQRELFTRLCAQDAWVLDSAYGKWLDVAEARATVIIALDYARWVSFNRLVKRTLCRVVDKKPVCNGNIESWRQVFSRNSILAWHVRSFSSKRRRIRAWKLTGRPMIIHKRARETREWLEGLRP